MTVLAQPASEPFAARPPGALGAAVGLFGVLGLLAYPAPLAWLGLAALLALGALRWWPGGRALPGGPFALPLGLYLLGGAVGLYTSVRPEMAQVRFFGLLAAAAGLLLVLDVARSPRAAGRLIVGLIVALLLGCLVLLVLVAPSLRLDRLPGALDALGRPLAGLIAASEPLRAPVLASEGVGQRYRLSTAGLGILAAYGLGLSLGPLLAGPDRRTRRLGALAAAACLVLVVLPANRSAMLIAALLPAALLALRYRRLMVAAVFAGLVAVPVLIFLLRATDTPGERKLPFLPEAFADLGPVHERLELWRNYLFLLEDFRLTGVGLGLRTVADVYQRRFLPIDPGFNHAHNMFLQSYLEQGLLGLLGLLGLVAVGLVLAARALRSARGPSARQAAISGSAAALVLILDGLTEIVPLTTVGMVLLFGALGLILASLRLERREESAARDFAAEPRPSARNLGARASSPAAACSTADLPSRKDWRAVRSMRPLRGRAGDDARAPSSHRLGPVGLLVAFSVVAGMASTPFSALAHASLILGRPPDPANPLAALGAHLLVNLGAVELNKGTLDDQPERGGPRRHQAAAEAWLRQALQLDPTNLAAYRNLAQLAVARAQPGDARKALADAREVAAEDDDLFHFQTARLYRETGSVDLALAAWARVDRRFGAWSCSHRYMQLMRWGLELLEAQRFESAEKIARAALKAQPGEPQPYRLLSAVLGAEGDEAAVLRAMEELIRSQPDIPHPYAEIQRLHARAGRTGEAEDWRRREGAVRHSTAWIEARQRSLDVRECRQYLPPSLTPR